MSSGSGINSATHTSSVNGIPPSGTRIDALGIHMWRLADGKLAEGWYLTDALPAVAAALVPAPAGVSDRRKAYSLPQAGTSAVDAADGREAIA